MGNSTTYGKSQEFLIKFFNQEITDTEVIDGTISALHALIDQADQILKAKKNADLIDVYNKDEVPAKYRNDVSKYFEILSDSKKRTNKKQ